MQRYKIEGGYYLNGDVYIDGSKNASLPIICASIILRNKVKLLNVPDIDDVRILLNILRKYNIDVDFKDNILIIDSSKMKRENIINDDMKRFRASYYLLGSLINVLDEVKICKQGGCKLGDRPIDLHKYAFERLGYSLDDSEKFYYLRKGGNTKKKIKFKKVSMGATINAILASLSVTKDVRIYNASLEPEVMDLINFLNVCGFNVEVKKKYVLVKREESLKESVEYKIMYDRIEAGSYALIAALIGNRVRIHNFNKDNLSSLLDTFERMNVKYRVRNDVLIVYKSKKIKSIDLQTDKYPGFPTDLFQMLSILCVNADDISILKDNIYPTRFSQLEEISKVGVEVENKECKYFVYGNSSFNSGTFSGKDLRGTMALIMYALNCNGTSYVYGVEYINRGYSQMVNKLLELGACIEVENVEE